MEALRNLLKELSVYRNDDSNHTLQSKELTSVAKAIRVEKQLAIQNDCYTPTEEEKKQIEWAEKYLNNFID